MKKSKRKIREKKETENSYRVEYKSCADELDYYTIIHARNEQEVTALFKNEFYTDKSEMQYPPDKEIEEIISNLKSIKRHLLIKKII